MCFEIPVLYIFYRYEHYMSISHIALIANMVHRDDKYLLENLRNPFLTYFASILWTSETCFSLCQGMVKTHVYFTFPHLVNFFLFLYPFHILFAHRIICIYFLLLGCVCVFFLLNSNVFILSFLPLCSVLVYQEYTNANIGPWWMET